MLLDVALHLRLKCVNSCNTENVLNQVQGQLFQLCYFVPDTSVSSVIILIIMDEDRRAEKREEIQDFDDVS